MYQSKALTSVPSTLKQLGDPVQFGQDNDNLRTAQPAINYAMQVKLNTAMSVPVGKIVSLDGAGYPGQPKLAKNNQGMYAISYVGIDSIYSHSMNTNPESDGWVDGDNIGSFNTKDECYELNIDFADFRYVYKALGYGNIFTEDNDFVLRFTFKLDGAATYPKSQAWFGVLGNRTTTAAKVGILFNPMGTDMYDALFMAPGYVTQSDASISVVSDELLTLDLIHSTTTNKTHVKIYNSNGQVGAMAAYNLFSGVSDCDNICVGADNYVGGSRDSVITIYGAEAWFNTVIIKTSIDSCRSWKRTYDDPVVVGNLVQESSVAIDDGGILHLAWSEKTGTPAGYYNIFYALFNNEEWVNIEKVSESTPSNDRLNPNIIIDPSGSFAHICWRVDKASGAGDIMYAYKNLIYMEEFELGFL